MRSSTGAMCWALLSFSISAVSADPLGTDPKFLRNAAPLDAGVVELYPALAMQAGYDSNIFESHSHVEDSYFSRLAPELSALLPFSAGAVQALYQADRIQYSDSSADNFTDQLFLARFHFEPSVRHRFSGDYSWDGTHEARGSGLTEGFDPVVNGAAVASPDELTDKRAHFKYEFGAITAPANLRFAFDTLQRDYTNHRDRTQYFDRDEVGAGVTFLWRAMPRTALLLETRARDISYETTAPGQPSLDSREYDYLAGVEWEFSEQTHGGLRVGPKNKDFSSAQRKDSTEIAWELNASWAPRTYSVIEADFHRTPEETNGQGDFIDLYSYALSWRHAWSQRFSSKISAYYDQAFYQAANQDRDTTAFQFQLSYQMYRWLNWKMAYDLRDRSSEVDALNMVRNRYTLGVEITL